MDDMTVKDLAVRLGAGTASVYRMLDEGLIDSYRVGNRYRITEKALEKFRTTTSAPSSGLTKRSARNVARRRAAK